MDIESATAAVSEDAGVLMGPFRTPANLAAGVDGSIHDDATAQRLGFRGGTVAGSVHMQQFPPLLVRAFGHEWFQTGTISTYFRNATMHGEPVRPFGRVSSRHSDAQIDLWMEREDGTLILEGTGSVGTPGERTYIEARLANLPPRGETRILARATPGTITDELPVPRADPLRRERQLEAMTERLDWYEGPTPWGGPIVNPGVAVGMFRGPEAHFNLNREGVVGLFGAIEVRHLDGPIMADRDYTCSGQLLYAGETPKSEYIWYRSTLHDRGRDVASMVMMLRFMKASSPLWAST